MEDPVNIKPVGSTSFVVGAALKIRSQFTGAAVVDDARIVLADGVC